MTIKLENKLQVEYRSVDSLIPYAKNSRTHSPEQIGQIAASIDVIIKRWENFTGKKAINELTGQEFVS